MSGSNIRVRLFNCLQREYGRELTPYEASRLLPQDLFDIRNFGYRAAEELRIWLDENNLINEALEQVVLRDWRYPDYGWRGPVELYGEVNFKMYDGNREFDFRIQHSK